MVSPAPRSTLFPYTTLFRSQNIPTGGAHGQIRQRCKQAGRIGDAAEEERDVEEQFWPESHQSEAGDRDRAERGTRERRESAGEDIVTKDVAQDGQEEVTDAPTSEGHRPLRGGGTRPYRASGDAAGLRARAAQLSAHRARQ